MASADERQGNYSALEGKAERVNITLPARILALVDTFARAHRESR